MERTVDTLVRKAPERGAAADTGPQRSRELHGEAFPRASVPIVAYCDGMLHQESRHVICERELTVVANGQQVVTLLCSDTSLRELAYGFLLSEGVIGSLEDVRACSIDRRTLTASFQLAVPVLRPACPVVSSGFGGKVLSPPSFRQGASRALAGAVSEPAFAIGDVMKAVGVMRSFAREYTITRGIHCSALFKRGAPLASFEDIGRHSTFDKLAGWCLLNGCSAEGALLTTTGRVSGEMVRKALRLGVSGIASLSGPTDKAIVMAREAGILLAGYVGETSASVYAGM